MQIILLCSDGRRRTNSSSSSPFRQMDASGRTTKQIRKIEIRRGDLFPTFETGEYLNTFPFFYYSSYNIRSGKNVIVLLIFFPSRLELQIYQFLFFALFLKLSLLPACSTFPFPPEEKWGKANIIGRNLQRSGKEGIKCRRERKMEFTQQNIFHRISSDYAEGKGKGGEEGKRNLI